MNTSIYYTPYRRRALKARLGHDVQMRFHWCSEGDNWPHINIYYAFNGWPTPPCHIHDVRIYLTDHHCSGGYHWMPGARRSGGFLWNESCDFNPHTGPIGDLLQIARFVAAGQCDPTLILGWIEDNWPTPWNLFASPDPREAIRALCPKPLATSETL